MGETVLISVASGSVGMMPALLVSQTENSEKRNQVGLSGINPLQHC